MKRKIILWVVAFIGAFLIAMLAMVIHDAKLMRRLETAQGGVYHLASWVEIYKGDKGKYPASLKELESGSANNQLVSQILHDPYNDQYTYELLANGFQITVRTEKSLFYKRFVGSKTFKPNEAISGKEWTGSEVHLVPE
ncbi:MAG: hypothetical protein ACXWBP_01170 [Limisphaerales bacterium]